MSRKTPLLDRLTSLLLRRPYVCPSCSSKRDLSTQAKRIPKPHFQASKPDNSLLSQRRQARHASIAGPISAVNAPRSTPPAFRKLDLALSSLEHKAAVYVNTSQLRLALRGLESANGVTRVAVLGLDSPHGAARLARALLADPLSPEPAWETELTDLQDQSGKTTLLSYGETFKVDSGHPLVKTLFIPSSALLTHNVEILVQGISTHHGFSGASSLLVPTLETPNSAGGRMSMVTYPIHKALIYAESLGTLTSIDGARDLSSMVQTVVDGSWSALQPNGGETELIKPINLSLGEVAIETLRRSLERSIEFEHAWFDSGMPSIASWLSEGTESQSGTLKPSVRRLVELVSASTHRAILEEEATQIREATAREVPTATREILDQGVSTWAEHAHTELRDRLNSAFSSPTWKKTKWWKLFWRVDEVGFIASDIVNRAWLIDAEKEMIFIVGRIIQSGLVGPLKLRPPPPPEDPADVHLLGGTPVTPSVSDLFDEVKPFDPEVEEPLVRQPWPQHISRARAALTRITIPPFQALAQTLLLQTVSTTFLTSTLSALVYISVPSSSVYEAGTIAALGLVLSLGRLQNKWEYARRVWEVTVRENGKEVLRLEERDLREAVTRESQEGMDLAAVDQRRGALQAVEMVDAALDEVRGGER